MVIGLIGDLEQKAIQEGETTQKSYAEFAGFCEDRARELSFEIKNGKEAVEELEATIEEQKATAAKLTAKIEELAGDVSSDSADLKKATEIREKEKATFVDGENQLMETVGMLKRAITALERGASMLQLKNAGNLEQTFSLMVQASLIGTADAAKLTALVQTAQAADDSADDGIGAPEAAAYDRQSGSIVDAMEDLLDKAENQLDSLRTSEQTAQNNFKLLKQSVGDEVQIAQKDMDHAKKGVAAAEEKKSGAEGELTIMKKELKSDIEAKRKLHHDCLSRAQAFESEMKGRDEELAVLAKAKQIIKESTEGTSFLDQQVSFVQVSSKRSSAGMQLTDFRVVRLVRNLGRKQGSSALVQLAGRMASAMRSKSGADPFVKVRGMISDMLSKLEDDASSDAQKQVYCEGELAGTKDKKSDTTDEVKELHTRVEQMTSKIERLKTDVVELQKELSKLIETQAEMDKMRAEEKAKFEKDKAVLEKALSGTQKAIKVLKEYFSQDGGSSSNGGASAIIGLLEETESKFSAHLAELTSDEEQAVREYNSMSQENAADKAAKEADLAYKTKEIKRTDKNVVETSDDESSANDQLSAVTMYLERIEKDCGGTGDSFEERQKRREAELAGLKQALEILDSETSLIQRHTSHRTLRGTKHHATIAA